MIFDYADKLPAARRRAAIAQAEYRHEWDYGTPESTAEALTKTIEARAAVVTLETIVAVYRTGAVQGRYAIDFGSLKRVSASVIRERRELEFPRKS